MGAKIPPERQKQIDALESGEYTGKRTKGTIKSENEAAIQNAKKITQFDNPADPFRDVIGSGSKFHPEEWNRLIKEMEENGVEVVHREDAMDYGPLRKGKPGQLLIDPEASMSA
ncbi:hypothetical protein [Paenibacillus polymyxa]|uniref:hypothetical protein n=1 Tax=Paenibacillus polymyxa TaxID=1406 RepID=UPI002ED3DF09|nr:hypothetical protein [Paenibacillus polymyxa]